MTVNVLDILEGQNRNVLCFVMLLNCVRRGARTVEGQPTTSPLMFRKHQRQKAKEHISPLTRIASAAECRQADSYPFCM